MRLKKRPDGYVFTVYPEGGLLEHVRANQEYFLGCVFAVVREWVAQGRQRTTESRHDFREWAQSLDWIVQHICGAAPLLDGHNEARDRVSDSGRSWLRAVALKMAAEGRLDHDVTASALAEVSSEYDIPLPNCRADVADDQRARVVGKAMSKVFADSNEAEVDCFKVTRSPKYNSKAEKEIPHYRFSQT